MRIGIIGTSNSILAGGYVEGMATQPGLEVVRIATVGESLGLLYAVLLNDDAVRACDVCVIDSAVNEELYIQYAKLPLQVIEEYLLGCIGKIWSLGCLPVLLCLPRKDVMAAKSSVVNLYASISERLNIPCFNVIELVERIQEMSNASRNFLFKDGGHLNAWCAFQIGRILGRILSSENGRPWAETRKTWQAHEYRNLPISRFELNDVETIQRKTTLIDIEMAILTSSSAASFQLDPNLEVCGVYFNLVQSFGIISIQADDELLFDLSNEYPFFAKGLLLSVQAFHQIIQCKNSLLRITVPKRAELDNQQSASIKKLVPLVGRRLQNEDKVEIGGILLRSAVPLPFESLPAPQELLARFSSPEIDEITEIVHARLKQSAVQT